MTFIHLPIIYPAQSYRGLNLILGNTGQKAGVKHGWVTGPTPDAIKRAVTSCTVETPSHLTACLWKSVQHETCKLQTSKADMHFEAKDWGSKVKC